MTESKHLKLMRDTLAQLEEALPDISDVKDHEEEAERIEVLKQDIHSQANWERLQEARTEPDAPVFSSGPAGGA